MSAINSSISRYGDGVKFNIIPGQETVVGLWFYKNTIPNSHIPISNELLMVPVNPPSGNVIPLPAGVPTDSSSWVIPPMGTSGTDTTVSPTPTPTPTPVPTQDNSTALLIGAGIIGLLLIKNELRD